ncbi:MAG: methyltransferase domain-containing protein [Gammaproteobacteria bacterium]|nr:methyltransferase domain-containing protein [Gammaproteobacteria bacterium]
MSTVFIVGTARAGTTSVFEALALSGQVQAALEPQPNLNLESRALYEGRLADPFAVLTRDLAPRVAAALARRPFYVEKQVSLLPFVPCLHRLFNCRFVVPVRDGRDVVASLINWHEQMYPIIYQECRDAVELGPHAREVLARQQGPDPFDTSLPRPPADDPWHAAWAGFSRFEMVAWYWSFVNRWLRTQLDQLPADRYLLVRYDAPDVGTIRRIYEFVGLDDFNEDAVGALLARRVNSLADRIGARGRFPSWNEWSPAQLQRFNDIAHETMSALGYADPVRPRPPGFGDWWQEEAIDEAWYEQIHHYRDSSHEAFRSWYAQVSAQVPIESVIDVGCGLGHGYREFFADRRFTGIDLSPTAIAWCREHDPHPGHEYHCCDVIESVPAQRADLVFSHGTIDNVYDIDAFLRALARMSGELLYIANYRGYFGAMSAHRYLWDAGTRVCFNDISARRCEQVLREEGFGSVLVLAHATGREDIASETVIIASRRELPPALLASGHRIHYDFAAYRVAGTDIDAGQILQQVDRDCGYFSTGARPLANTLRDFESLLRDLRDLPGRRPGALAALARGEGEVNTALRVDVDMDLVAALRMAAIAGREGVPITFFLLHSAAYYGRLQDGVFRRNEAAASWYRALQDSGAEVGLHVDPYLFYVTHGIDGAQAVSTELAWLRAQGVRVRATTAHNAAPVYGAENFEIFAGRDVNGVGFFRRHYRFYPTGVLSERALDLDYEGSAVSAAAAPAAPAARRYLEELPAGDLVRNERWFRTYLFDNPYCRWGYDGNVWVLGKDFWVIAGGVGDGRTFRFGVSWHEVRDWLAELPPSASVALTLHPVYFGYREQGIGSPVY